MDGVCLGAEPPSASALRLRYGRSLLRSVPRTDRSGWRATAPHLKDEPAGLAAARSRSRVKPGTGSGAILDTAQPPGSQSTMGSKDASLPGWAAGAGRPGN